MNWKLTQAVPGEPGLDDWSKWRAMGEEIPILEYIYQELVERGEADGVEKLADGVYRVTKRWHVG